MPREKAPAYQRYPKQIMGDDKVLLMDWDAYGMHNWLLDISWQQEPRGTIPNDQAVLRRWLRNPSEEVWRRVWPQISTAWPLQQSGRLGNSGMLRCAEKQKNYSLGNRGKEQYVNGTQIGTQIEQGLPRKSVEDEVRSSPVLEVAFDLQAFDFEESFLALHGVYPRRKDNHATRNFYIEAIEKVVKNRGFRRSEAAAYILSRAQIYVSKSKFIAGLDRFLCDGIYEQDEAMWESSNGANQQNGPQRVSAAAARNERNADAIANVARKIGIDPSLATTGSAPAQGRTDGGGHRVLAAEPVVIPPVRD